MSDTPGPGRPELPPEERKSERVTVYLKPSQRENLQRLAHLRETSEAAVMRLLIEIASAPETFEKLAGVSTPQLALYMGQLQRLGGNINQLARAVSAIDRYIQQDGSIRRDHQQRFWESSQQLGQQLPELQQLLGQLLEVLAEERGAR